MRARAARAAVAVDREHQRQRPSRGRRGEEPPARFEGALRRALGRVRRFGVEREPAGRRGPADRLFRSPRPGALDGLGLERACHGRDARLCVDSREAKQRAGGRLQLVGHEVLARSLFLDREAELPAGGVCADLVGPHHGPARGARFRPLERRRGRRQQEPAAREAGHRAVEDDVFAEERVAARVEVRAAAPPFRLDRLSCGDRFGFGPRGRFDPEDAPRHAFDRFAGISGRGGRSARDTDRDHSRQARKQHLCARHTPLLSPEASRRPFGLSRPSMSPA